MVIPVRPRPKWPKPHIIPQSKQRREAIERELESLQAPDPDWWAFLTPGEAHLFAGMRVPREDYSAFPPQGG